MNTPEFDFTAEQPNRLFEKWWAEQAEYRHRQTGISEARAIWLCSWRAYGEACRASLASTPAPVLTDERVKSELMDALEIYGRAKLIEGKEDSGSAEEHRSAVAFLSVLECFDRAILASPVPPAPATGEQGVSAAHWAEFERMLDQPMPERIKLLLESKSPWEGEKLSPQAAPATGSVLTDEQIDKFAVQFLSASAPTRNAYDVRRFARAILAAKGETS